MQKVKNFLNKFWIIIVAIIAGLLYILKLKDDEISILQAEAELARTEKEVEAIEKQIIAKVESRQLNKFKIKQAEKALAYIENKKRQLDQYLTDKEKEDYWNN